MVRSEGALGRCRESLGSEAQRVQPTLQGLDDLTARVGSPGGWGLSDAQGACAFCRADGHVCLWSTILLPPGPPPDAQSTPPAPRPGHPGSVKLCQPPKVTGLESTSGAQDSEAVLFRKSRSCTIFSVNQMSF